MRIDTITGSSSTADNVTSFYTFVLGLVVGGFIAVGVGAVDMETQLRGDLLRVYLALATAMLGGGVGLFVSRLGDRIADRRSRKRAMLRVLNGVRELSDAISGFAMGIYMMSELRALDADDQRRIIRAANHIYQVAERDLDFSDVIDDFDELKMAKAVREVISVAKIHFHSAELAGKTPNDKAATASFASALRNDTSLERLVDLAGRVLSEAEEFYVVRLNAL